MKNTMLFKVMSTILVVALLFSFSVLPAAAEAADTNLTIAISSDAPGVAYDGTVKITIQITDNPGLLGANFDVKWDTAVLELVEADTTGADFTTVSAIPQEQFGKVVMTVGDPMWGLMFPNIAEQYTGTGKIATLTFKVKAAVLEDTETTITMDRASYVDFSGETVDTVVLNSVQLNAAGKEHTHNPLRATSCADVQRCTFCHGILPAPSHLYVNGTCTVCGDTIRIPGDLDSNNLVNRDDVIKLLLHVTMPGRFPIEGKADFTGDDKVNRDDVIKLLLHVTMPGRFPL